MRPFSLVPPSSDAADEPVAVDGKPLRMFVERIERLEESRRLQALAIIDLYRDAQAAGYDQATVHAVIRCRRMDERSGTDEMSGLFHEYMRAMSLVVDGAPGRNRTYRERLPEEIKADDEAVLRAIEMLREDQWSQRAIAAITGISKSRVGRIALEIAKRPAPDGEA